MIEYFVLFLNITTLLAFVHKWSHSALSVKGIVHYSFSLMGEGKTGSFTLRYLTFTLKVNRVGSVFIPSHAMCGRGFFVQTDFSVILFRMLYSLMRAAPLTLFFICVIGIFIKIPLCCSDTRVQ